MREKPLLFILILLIGLIQVTALSCFASSENDAVADEVCLVIRAEWTFDSLGDEAVRGLTILCRGDTIEAIGPDIAVPENARIVDAPGMCVMPGLIDAHVRLFDGFEITPIYLFPAFGVTTICDFENSVLRAEGLWDTIATGQVLGPNMVYSGESLTDKTRPTPLQLAVESDDEVKTAIQHLADHGAGLVALSSGISRSAAAAAAEGASAAGLKAAADLLENREINAFDALKMKVNRLDRMGGVPQALRVDRENVMRTQPSVLFDWLDGDAGKETSLIKALASDKIFLVPTLVAFEQMSQFKEKALAPENLHPALLKGTVDYWTQVWDGFETTPWWPAACRLHLEYSKLFIRKAVESGARIVAGSATPTPGVCPGLGLHRELELLVQAGLSPAQAIKAATSVAAECLGKEASLGTLEPGKRADLLIVEGNPLEDIRATRNISWVVLGGKIVKREEIPGL